MGKTIAIKKTRVTSLMTALFIAANIGLPHLFHLIPGGGIMFLPIYFFTAFAAVSFGMWTGILTAVLSPLMGYLVFGMPQIMLLPDMMLKGVLLSCTLTYMLSKAETVLARFLVVPSAVLIAWGIAGILELTMRTYEVAFQDFFTGIPGLLMMTVAGWMALFFNKRIAQ
ncbi:MAG: ECF transporter S component [Prevotella sp.]|nr:ECF transporter S component [Candidatus Prevotella equi]